MLLPPSPLLPKPLAKITPQYNPSIGLKAGSHHPQHQWGIQKCWGKHRGKGGGQYWENIGDSAGDSTGPVLRHYWGGTVLGTVLGQH